MLARTGRRIALTVRHRPRLLLWSLTGVAVFGFLVALEVAARRYGVSGPLTRQSRELISAPDSGPLLYAGLALTMVVLTWRQRFLALGTAIGLDLVFWLVRWLLDARENFGNGALWVILGCAVIAVVRRTGAERTLLLKGVGLGLLLVAGHKTGDTWLFITSRSRPTVLDPYVVTVDHALGNPSWLVGRIVQDSGPVGSHLIGLVYGQLPLAAAVVALYQLRNVVTERRFPGHHLVRTFLVIGLVGPVVYMLFPTVGPIFAYGTSGGHWAVADVWPHAVPRIGSPHGIPFDAVTPRNCMPSLHTAWATTLFIHSRKGPRALRWAGAFWLVATLVATLGFGYHYGADLVAGAVFALTIEATMRSLARGWDRSASLLVSYGVTVFAALLVTYRWLPVEMARHSRLFGPLLILVLVTVIVGYVRTTERWEHAAVGKQRPELSPEPV